ncbi:hypothetical protein EAF04_000058 [Stromatinia cepivora]|nr:hypothetical protein EAF04_000058 [Stromatinia cepivora]
MNHIIDKWAEITNPELPLTAERLKLIVLISTFASTVYLTADFIWQYYIMEPWAANIERDGIIYWAKNIWQRYSDLLRGLFGSDSIVGPRYNEVPAEEGNGLLQLGEEILSEQDADTLELSEVRRY